MARIGRLLLLVGVSTWLAAPAQAQMWGRPQPKMPETQVNNTGTIESVNGSMITVTTGDNQTWSLYLKRDTKVKVTGKGNASSLAPGQNVSFSATASGKRGTITEKISKISVVTSPDQMPMAGGMGLNAGPEPKQPKSKLGKNAGTDVADAGGPTEMTGVVSRVVKNRVTLTVNGRKQIIELADDVEVAFDLEGVAALASVSPGAKIEFKGKGQGNLPRAVVDDVKVEVVPGEAHAGKHTGHKPLHAKSKKSSDDQPDAGTDDTKPEPKKPAHKTHKKPADTDTDDTKPADSGDAPAKDK
jgi:hypothetical protein